MAPITAQINFYWKIYDYVFGYKIAMFISGLYLKWCVCVSARARAQPKRMRLHPKDENEKMRLCRKVYGQQATATMRNSNEKTDTTE